ncbi:MULTISPECIES: TatD family hydrolase [Deefgea]|uniref:TatD family deoxyribonuclease n=1 Tax=Deefgea chitinilytica TaxID=570276 RepID=A0ABS2CD13_9NEIS|nr:MULTISPECIES: TatD family hydrolase [Deefgea]MBM5572015.1 TatD family deoxyribonuclease [Deefgea chitinilytica]MBM9889250.1 TatD family hydrolase [Deefgea sp. CFH1-16]
MSGVGEISFIDSHCHLDAAEFDLDRDAVIERSIAAGVTQWVVPAVTSETFASTRQMQQKYGTHIAFGLHPIYEAQHRDEHLLLLRQELDVGDAVAVGEIGLDFYLPELNAERQIHFFEAQLKIARDYDLPVIVHIRRSQDQVLKYLRKWKVRGGIAHAFNGSEQQAAEFIKLGFCLGFGGALTYSGSQRIRRLAQSLPLESLVLETDAPDITPSWLAGPPPRRNEPAELRQIAVCLADLRGITLHQLAVISLENTQRVLGIATM